jgi:PPOX class probable F420-dependent enzyme
MPDELRSIAGGAPTARAGARPVPGRRLPAALALARLAARTAPRGAREIAEAPRTGSLEDLGHCKRTLLVTYRRDGRPVPTPVWAAPAPADGAGGAGGVLYVRSERGSGKVKRVRRDARMLIAPCTAQGKPLGAPLEARARVLGAEEEPLAEWALAIRYGRGRELFERAMDLLRVDMCYLEITPGAWESSESVTEAQAAAPASGRRALLRERSSTNEGGAIAR